MYTNVLSNNNQCHALRYSAGIPILNFCKFLTDNHLCYNCSLIQFIYSPAWFFCVACWKDCRACGWSKAAINPYYSYTINIEHVEIVYIVKDLLAHWKDWGSLGLDDWNKMAAAQLAIPLTTNIENLLTVVWWHKHTEMTSEAWGWGILMPYSSMHVHSCDSLVC